MAISSNNVVTHGLTGKVGDLLIFKRRNGKTVVSKIPEKSNSVLSEAQLAVQYRFKLAIKYASQAMQNEEKKRWYDQKARNGQTAFNVAFADYFMAPSLSEASKNYDGQIGTLLTVIAEDKIGVSQVSVTISKADGTLIEEGEATLQMDGMQWAYSCSVAQSLIEGCQWVWLAKDHAGNSTQLKMVME